MSQLTHDSPFRDCDTRQSLQSGREKKRFIVKPQFLDVTFGVIVTSRHDVIMHLRFWTILTGIE